MIEHPQQTDRTLRDTRILTLRIWAVVGCIVIAAVIFNLMGNPGAGYRVSRCRLHHRFCYVADH